MGSGVIECFECNSWDDPRCHDPFNYTLHKYDMPKIRVCGGCCVKMVQFLGTGWYRHTENLGAAVFPNLGVQRVTRQTYPRGRRMVSEFLVNIFATREVFFVQ